MFLDLGVSSHGMVNSYLSITSLYPGVPSLTVMIVESSRECLNKVVSKPAEQCYMKKSGPNFHLLVLEFSPKVVF